MIFSATTVAGHRGWPTEHPDNTLAGFGAAFGVTDMVETDIQQTLDGVLVLAHDIEVGGMTVGETEWGMLREHLVDGHHRIPTLPEALAAFSDRRFDLELKNFPGLPGYHDQLPIRVADLARPQDIVTSFYWPDLDAIRQARPSVHTGVLFEDSIPVAQAIEHCIEHGHRAIAPRHDVIERRDIEAAHDENLAVLAWTVNDVDDARRLTEWGVNVIVTDEPGSIVHLVEDMK